MFISRILSQHLQLLSLKVLKRFILSSALLQKALLVLTSETTFVKLDLCRLFLSSFYYVFGNSCWLCQFILPFTCFLAKCQTHNWQKQWMYVTQALSFTITFSRYSDPRVRVLVYLSLGPQIDRLINLTCCNVLNLKRRKLEYHGQMLWGSKYRLLQTLRPWISKQLQINFSAPAWKLLVEPWLDVKLCTTCQCRTSNIKIISCAPAEVFHNTNSNTKILSQEIELLLTHCVTLMPLITPTQLTFLRVLPVHLQNFIKQQKSSNVFYISLGSTKERTSKKKNNMIKEKEWGKEACNYNYIVWKTILNYNL